MFITAFLYFGLFRMLYEAKKFKNFAQVENYTTYEGGGAVLFI